MNDRAFFFQGNTLLLPANFQDAQIETGISLELAKKFAPPDIFEIPSIDASGSQTAVIRGVSVLPGVLPENWKGIPLRQILGSLSGGANTGDIIRACHIAQWRRESVFCGSCGARNTDSDTEVMRLCPKCGRQEFPRICPAIIVVITDDENRILLAHNKKFRQGMYSHISGFNEAGESLEETVAREVREEVNIEVMDVVYIKSQPWPFPNSLMLGFRARYSSGTIHPDGVEIEDAKWFTKDNLPELPAKGSISRFLIDSWVEGGL